MSTVPPGLAALEAAATALATAVNSAIGELQSLSSQLVALNSEDPQVASVAASLSTPATNLGAAVTAATPPPIVQAEPVTQVVETSVAIPVPAPTNSTVDPVTGELKHS
jgi:hypothetical protein